MAQSGHSSKTLNQFEFQNRKCTPCLSSCNFASEHDNNTLRSGGDHNFRARVNFPLWKNALNYCHFYCREMHYIYQQMRTQHQTSRNFFLFYCQLGEYDWWLIECVQCSYLNINVNEEVRRPFGARNPRVVCRLATSVPSTRRPLCRSLFFAAIVWYTSMAPRQKRKCRNARSPWINCLKTMRQKTWKRKISDTINKEKDCAYSTEGSG